MGYGNIMSLPGRNLFQPRERHKNQCNNIDIPRGEEAETAAATCPATIVVEHVHESWPDKASSLLATSGKLISPGSARYG